MNLLQVRTKFVDTSGRFDLVVDTTNYADNGANFFIQAGQRYLDTILPEPQRIRAHRVDIAAGDFQVYMKYLRWAEKVEIFDSSKLYSELEYMSWDDLQELYTEHPSGMAQGVPADWAMGVHLPSPEQESLLNSGDLVINGNFDTSLTGWTFGSGWTHDATEKTASKAAGNTNSIYQDILAVSTTYKVTYTIKNYVAGSIQLMVGDSSNLGPARSADGTYTETLASTATGTFLGFVPDASFDGDIDTVVVKQSPDYADTFSFDVDTLSFNSVRKEQQGIEFRPTSSGTYTLKVTGAFFSKMEADTDQSYHSVVYPELSVMAARMAVEAFYRNSTGINDWVQAMRLWLRGLDHNDVSKTIARVGNQISG